MRLLIVEDNKTLAQGLKKVLGEAGYAVDVLHDGKEAETVLGYQDYSILILDLGLPGLDGIELLKRLKKKKKDMPVMIISARDQLDQRIMGLDIGADDYLCKPFAFEEVTARIRALIRRSYRKGKSKIVMNNLVFDGARKTIMVKNKRLHLKKREYSIFECLLNNVGRVVSKSDIASQVSSFDKDFNPQAVETYISRLRKKIGDNVKIETVYGLGYLIENPVEK